MSITILADGGPILASGSSSIEDGSWFGLLFLLAGPLFYAMIFLRYRNVDKRHRHATETEATMDNLRERNDYVRTRTGLKNKKMTGANSRDYGSSGFNIQFP
ncbi:hypothetical protein [Ruania albidiflava]|uniref:hypothetical protein n=1 Tax=Ruania albidiflava TaxID=366586 RepID=UPI0004262F8D|nr:hypothetical protein [Ruania albidiflava]